jgi:hypothetical protein
VWHPYLKHRRGRVGEWGMKIENVPLTLPIFSSTDWSACEKFGFKVIPDSNREFFPHLPIRFAYALGRIRTYDQGIRNPLLYPLSYESLKFLPASLYESKFFEILILTVSSIVSHCIGAALVMASKNC